MRTNSAIAFLLFLVMIAVAGGSRADSDGSELSFLVYGASGKVGRHVVDEALARGHGVTAVSRDPARIVTRHLKLEVTRGDLLDAASVRALVAGHDIVVVSVRGVAGERPEDAVTYRGVRNVVEALRGIGDGAARLIHVGGAGSLEVDSGELLADRLPKIFLPKKLELEIAGQVLALDWLRSVTDVDWTYITPPKKLSRGKRTGVYRIGGDRLMKDSRGKSTITRADFAVAVIDEAENRRHTRRRFSVAY